MSVAGRVASGINTNCGALTANPRFGFWARVTAISYVSANRGFTDQVWTKHGDAGASRRWRDVVHAVRVSSGIRAEADR